MTRRVPKYSIPYAGVGDLLPAWRREHRRRAEFTVLEGIDVVLVTTHPPRANENQNKRSADEQEREQHRAFPSTPSYPSDQIAGRRGNARGAGLSSRGRPLFPAPAREPSAADRVLAVLSFDPNERLTSKAVGDLVAADVTGKGGLKTDTIRKALNRDLKDRVDSIDGTRWRTS
jgi:hypothetical protein